MKWWAGLEMTVSPRHPDGFPNLLLFFFLIGVEPDQCHFIHHAEVPVIACGKRSLPGNRRGCNDGVNGPEPCDRAYVFSSAMAFSDIARRNERHVKSSR